MDGSELFVPTKKHHRKTNGVNLALRHYTVLSNTILPHCYYHINVKTVLIPYQKCLNFVSMLFGEKFL